MSEDYSQPDFYRFNEDSTALIKWVLDSGLTPSSVLDLGAGSGILGIELARILKPQTLTLVEVQDEFLPFLKINTDRILPPSVTPVIVIKKFSEYSSADKFDLIVCNPPYYLPGKGEVSKNPNRAVARSFMVDSWTLLLAKISELLASEGRAFIVLKSDDSLLKMITQEVKNLNLSVKKNELHTVMIVELFRLNKNGN
jgi:tRNA1Val (adenine37-N6)-methyltransferase